MIVNYISRKQQLGYNSIESLFETIQNKISAVLLFRKVNLNYAGASPLSIIKNLFDFNGKSNHIYHITGDVHYMAIVTGENTILTIHDISSAIKGSFLKKLYIKLFWFWIPALIVKKITVISAFTKNELIGVIPFARKKIVVVPNPVNPKLEFSSKKFNETNPRILLVGTKENKNLIRVFEALHGLNVQLHIIGNLNKKQLEVLKKLNLKFQNHFNLDFEEIVAAYQNCDLLCFPSTYEGFGMPIIEAQSVGRPVVTSNFGAMKEVAQNSACFVDPFDVDSIKNGILKVVQNQNYREDLVKKGLENIKRFQLDEIAEKYMKLYKEIG